MFKSMDKDEDGSITCDELLSGLRNLGTKLSEAEAHQLVKAVRFYPI